MDSDRHIVMFLVNNGLVIDIGIVAHARIDDLDDALRDQTEGIGIGRGGFSVGVAGAVHLDGIDNPDIACRNNRDSAFDQVGIGQGDIAAADDDIAVDEDLTAGLAFDPAERLLDIGILHLDRLQIAVGLGQFRTDMVSVNIIAVKFDPDLRAYS